MDASAQWPPEQIAAGVVLYHPTGAASDLVAELARQFNQIFIVENESSVCERQNAAVWLHRNPINAGLAKAINQLCDGARESGFDWLVLFDQDSKVTRSFRDRFTRLFPKLKGAPALLAANYATELCGQTFRGYRLKGDSEIAEQVTDLNAGSLINLRVHRQLGGHCEALFVDHVDHEYCLRLRRHGFPVVATRETLFVHEVGNIVCRRRLGRVWQSGGHPPSRRREATEALVLVIKSYWKSEPGWCARMLFFELPRNIVAMLILERQRGAKIRATANGLFRGIFRTRLCVL